MVFGYKSQMSFPKIWTILSWAILIKAYYVLIIQVNVFRYDKIV